MLGCTKHEHYELIKYAYMVPLYWLAMSVAGWIALAELLYKPHYWNKTKHGLHLNKAIQDLTIDAGAVSDAKGVSA